MIRRVLLFLTLIAGTAGQPGRADGHGWPVGSVTHKLFDTGDGYLHYVTSGDNSVKSRPPMVLLHSYPRSTLEFKYLIQTAKSGQPFIAVDYFGMGASEEYAGQQFSHPFCTAQDMAQHVCEILRLELGGECDEHEFSVVGHMEGAHVAISLASSRPVKKLVLLNPLILSPSGKAIVDNKRVPMLKQKQVQADGSHLLAAWNDPSTAPTDLGLFANQEKTMDELGALNTGWQYVVAWSEYNGEGDDHVYGQLLGLGRDDVDVDILFIYGEAFLADAKKQGLDPQFSFDTFARASADPDKPQTYHNTTKFIKGAGQHMLVENVSVLAPIIMDFVSTPPPFAAVEEEMPVVHV